MLKRADDLGGRPEILPLTADAVCYSAGGKTLIDGVTLTLEAGAKTLIMGPNGAGKSLLMRLLHGLIKPERGEILWAGRKADAAIAKRQAMVFQRPVLLRRSALANITFVLSQRALAKDERMARAKAFLGIAGLGALAETPARLLSGGEQQRLAIARALALDPDVLFLDEPAANLDPAATQAVEELIEQANENGTKIVMVTQDIGQARRLADEVVFMHGGRIAEHSDASAFFSEPLSEAAQGFLDGRIVV